MSRPARPSQWSGAGPRAQRIEDGSGAGAQSAGLHQVVVTGARMLTPRMRRVTLCGPSLVDFPYAGPDQRVKLFVPAPGQAAPDLRGAATIQEYLAIPPALRPIMRTYTVRNHRAAAGEVDLDFALHGDLAGMGPASRWAMRAQPGDRAALFGPAASYCPPPDARWLLIAGDECALPAIGGIVASLPPGVPSRALVEIPDEGERQDIAAPPGSTLAELAWLSRRGGPARHSTLLIDAIRRRPIPDGPGYVWLAGESSVVRGLRRHLVWDRGLDRGRITFSGYWRAGHAESDN